MINSNNQNKNYQSGQRFYNRHYEDFVLINARPEEIFSYIDDHAKLSSHMNDSSWMMACGRMETTFDEGHGQKVGSHIKMNSKIFGTALFS